MKMQIEFSNCGGLEYLSWEQQRRIQTCVTRASQVFTLFDKEGFWGWLLHHSNGGIIRMICRFWWWHWLESPLLLMWVKSCCLGLLFPARKSHQFSVSDSNPVHSTGIMSKGKEELRNFQWVLLQVNGGQNSLP